MCSLYWLCYNACESTNNTHAKAFYASHKVIFGAAKPLSPHCITALLEFTVHGCVPQTIRQRTCDLQKHSIGLPIHLEKHMEYNLTFTLEELCPTVNW